MQEWVSKEDDFVLKQSKKKAKIRVRDGRAKPIDWLVVLSSVEDKEKDLLDDDDIETELDVVDPEIILQDIPPASLQELEKEIEHYLILEKDDKACVYWKALITVCKHRRQLLNPSGAASRSITSVSGDVDQLLGPKTLEQLRGLERQVYGKLQSNEPIDEEYWEQLLDNIKLYKAKAQLKDFYKAVVDNRLRNLKQSQIDEAYRLRRGVTANQGRQVSTEASAPNVEDLDPEPKLKLSAEDKNLEVLDETDFVTRLTLARTKVERLRYIPTRQGRQDKNGQGHEVKPHSKDAQGVTGTSRSGPESSSQAMNALYHREVARGVDDDEEVFAGEEEVSTASKPQWANKYRPRKPRYFNRVQMGYEWNKYNQTHYDHDNPPPKVVQGYKFNVFYPDLIDKTKAPTYRIERENGRKKGQSFAPAGEEDTCLIRFMSGPPYEDLAFRIIDKEWDYSAKRERGFRSSFDKVSYR